LHTFLSVASNSIDIIITIVGLGNIMRTVYEREVANATKIQRAIVQGDARLCRPQFGVACKALWPVKTAETLAAIVGCSVRAAAYEISGEREPSALSILAVITEITPKRAP